MWLVAIVQDSTDYGSQRSIQKQHSRCITVYLKLERFLVPGQFINITKLLLNLTPSCLLRCCFIKWNVFNILFSYVIVIIVLNSQCLFKAFQIFMFSDGLHFVLRDCASFWEVFFLLLDFH